MLAYLELSADLQTLKSSHLISHGDRVRQGNGFDLAVLIPSSARFIDTAVIVKAVTIDGSLNNVQGTQYFNSALNRGYVFHKLYPTEMTFGLVDGGYYTQYIVHIPSDSEIVAQGAVTVGLNIAVNRISVSGGVTTYTEIINAQNVSVYVERVFAKPQASNISKTDADRLAMLIAANFNPQTSGFLLGSGYFAEGSELVINYRPANGIGVVYGNLIPTSTLHDALDGLSANEGWLQIASLDVTGKIAMKAQSVSFSDSSGSTELKLRYTGGPTQEDPSARGYLTLWMQSGYYPATAGVAISFTLPIAIELDYLAEQQIDTESLYNVGVDTEPTEGSTNFVTSGAIYDFVVSAFTGEDLTSFVTLAALQADDYTMAGDWVFEGGTLALKEAVTLDEGFSLLKKNGGMTYTITIPNETGTLATQAWASSHFQTPITVDTAPASGSANPISSGAVYSAISTINAKLVYVVHLKGSSAYADVPAVPEVGDLYNITDDFAITALGSLVASGTAGATDYPAGTNIVWTQSGKWDTYGSSNVDLSEQLAEISQAVAQCETYSANAYSYSQQASLSVNQAQTYANTANVYASNAAASAANASTFAVNASTFSINADTSAEEASDSAIAAAGSASAASSSAEDANDDAVAAAGSAAAAATSATNASTSATNAASAAEAAAQTKVNILKDALTQGGFVAIDTTFGTLFDTVPKLVVDGVPAETQSNYRYLLSHIISIYMMEGAGATKIMIGGIDSAGVISLYHISGGTLTLLTNPSAALYIVASNYEMLDSTHTQPFKSGTPINASTYSILLGALGMAK